jgi:hypothetical protein
MNADEEVSLMAGTLSCGDGDGQQPMSVLSHAPANETRRDPAALTLDRKRACSPASAIRVNRQDNARRFAALRQ